MTQAIHKSALDQWLKNHEDWHFEDGKIVMQAKFEDFLTAFGFLTSVALLSEKQNHHPTIENTFNIVRLSLSTHDADGKITDKDLKLAEAIDRL